jgi:hypothetical protein
MTIAHLSGKLQYCMAILYQMLKTVELDHNGLGTVELDETE